MFGKFALQNYLLNMEAELILLPKRNANKQATFKNADKAQFFTNYYEIVFDQQSSVLYQYVIESEIPSDSTEVLYKVVRSLKKQLKEKIGLLSFRGQMLWGQKPSPIAINLLSKFQRDQKQFKTEVLIKQTKEIRIFDLLKGTPQDAAKAIQILNIKNKQKLRNLNMVDLGMGKFYSKKGMDDNLVKESGLKVWRGFKFSINIVNANPVMQIDVCSRVLRKHNFAQTINDLNKQQILSYIGQIVVTRYGNNRTYKIQDIDFTKNPMSTFPNYKQSGDISFEKYYAQNYMLKVQNKKQPLIYTISKVIKEIKNGKIVQTPQYVYLIPEFVCLTGMSDEDRKDHNVMKNVADYTKLTVEERVKLTEEIKEKLNGDKEKIFDIGKSKKAGGWILDQPQIKTAENTVKRAKDGSIQIRDRIKEPATFNDWVFVYSVGNKPEYDDKDADYAVQTMSKAQQAFGITSKQPGFIVIKGRRVEDWKNEIEKDAKANGKPQIIVLFLNPNQQKYYGELKRFITNEIQVPSQFIRKRTLSQKSKNPLSCASKILLQMNAKVGKALWEVKSQAAYFKDKSVMYGALSVSKGKGGYTVAFVGTINKTFTNVYSDCKVGIKRKQEIPAAVLENMFIQWAKNYFITNKSAPDVILLYREGLSDAQVAKQLPVEIDSLKAMVTKVQSKLGGKKYRPQIMIIGANKKINSRFYAPVDKGHHAGKYAPKLANPVSGSVVLQEMSVANAYDFHLVPQLVTQGTCTPTLYRVMYDASNIPQQTIVEFTFEQCFNYYNWAGAVRVPFCLQGADKLSKLVGEYIRQDIKSSDIQNKQYFL